MGVLNDLSDYKKLIATRASRNSTEILANAGPDHAVIAMGYLFEHTNFFVKMVVGSLDEIVCDDDFYNSQLKACLDRGVTFEIIYLNNLNTKSIAYKTLMKHSGQVRIVKGTDKFIEQLSKSGKQQHFSIHDGDKFRFEKDTEKYLAWFSFNNPYYNQELTQVFDSEINRHKTDLKHAAVA